MTNKYEPVIGLEVHAQLLTRSKLFSSAPTDFGAEPNINTTPVCLGWPGSLPVLNERALHLAIKAGLALNCEIAKRTKFDRKHYFYPDLPKAYQISQYDMPINKQGWITIEKDMDGRRQERRIGITRAHLEEDAGKLLHDEIQDGTLVDYNRAGVPLLEIVSDPDIRSPEEAYEYLVGLKAILEYIEVSDCNMEEGSLRCDANVSIRPVGTDRLGTKTEIKNLNSFKAVQKALEYEIGRQRQVLDEGGAVVQETRLWDDARAQTFVMRSKEEAHDYRYFPEPDLVPFSVSNEMIEDIRKTLPELPLERRKRFVEAYELNRYDAQVLVQDKKLGDYFEACVREAVNPKIISNWIQSELLALLNEQNLSIAECPVSPRDLAGLIRLIDDQTISGKIAKGVLPEMFKSKKSSGEIVKAQGLEQVTDAGAIEGIIDEVMSKNPKTVADYKAGKKQALGFLVGQIMKATQGKANPKMVNEILIRKL